MYKNAKNQEKERKNGKKRGNIKNKVGKYRKERKKMLDMQN